ncbi:MAG: class II D-tagatose-bisphosphate aldolase, non-catalytic subunit [Propionivibrio sp.]
MTTSNPLLDMVRDQKAGKASGVASLCTANEWVIRAAMDRLLTSEQPLLIEATANQVNQYGGYTGMRPADFVAFVRKLADEADFPAQRIVLGGDHLGPLTWKSNPVAEAMQEAHVLIRAFVLAGFTKIHLDTSMRLADDDARAVLDTAVIAGRGAELAQTAEQAYAELRASQPDAMAPVYIVGSEVPIPGGAQSEEEGLHVTTVADLEATVETFRASFAALGLDQAWQRVIAVVVQPGVEFGDESIAEYDRAAAAALCAAGKALPNLVFEGHSTDYQTPQALKQMVEDGIAILKVGPALTFALREALFSLNLIEKELFRYAPEVSQSNFIDVLDEAMLRRPANWQSHYHGTPAKIRLARKFSFSDRARYDLPDPEVQESLALLLGNLGAVKIPLTLISQFMPIQYRHVRAGKIAGTVEDLLKNRVVDCLDEYLYAVTPSP